MNVWHFLGLWLLLSIVLAPLIGHCVHFGMNGPKPGPRFLNFDNGLGRNGGYYDFR